MSVLRIALQLLLTLMFAVHGYAADQKVINLSEFSEGSITAGDYSYLPDPDSHINAHNVRDSNLWLSGAQAKTVKSITNGAVWMRLYLQNPTSENLQVKLEHTEARINKITLFVFNDKQKRNEFISQFDLFGQVANRPYPHHRAVFPIELPANTTTEIYFKFEYLPDVRGAIYTEFKIWKSNAFERSHIIEVALLTLFFISHILMGLVTLSIYIFNRDRVFLFYTFYAFATVGTRAATNGMLGFVVYTDGMALSELVFPIAAYQMTIFLFAREFLQVRRVAPYWDIVLKLIMACCLVSMLAALSGYARYIGLLTEAITASYPIILIISFICWHRGVPNALVFAMGWTLLLAGGMISFAARDSGLIEHAPWSYWLAHIGALIEVFLLAGLLASRVIRMQQAKDLVERKYQKHLESYSEELQKKVEQQTIELKIAKENAEKEARTDVLTGLTNRRYFMENSTQAIERAKRNLWDLWLVTVDIDHFKQVNDTYGHTAGDSALQTVAKVLESNIRNHDVVARTGGEEFTLLIEGGQRDEVLHVCERLRQSIESVPILYEGHIIAITISIGVAKKRADESFEQLINRSDKALFKAKEKGRNRVVEEVC